MNYSYDDTFEQCILAAIINRPTCLDELYTDVYFITPKWKELLKELQVLYKKYRMLDFTILAKEVKTVSVDVLFELSEKFISESTFDYYQQKIIEAYQKYQINLLTKKLINKEMSTEEYISKIKELDKNSSGNSDAGLFTEDEIFNMATSKNDEIKFNKLSFFKDYFHFQEHTVNVIGARPAVGKTAFTLHLVEDLRNNYQCLMFSYEMQASELYKRLVAMLADIKVNSMSKESFVNEGNNYSIIKGAARNLSENNFKIFTSGNTINDVRKAIIRECKKGKHVIAFIDHVGYLYPNEKYSGEYEKTTSVTRALQILTKQYNCTIFLLSHTHRNGDGSMDSLKGSGELEQSAHAVMLLDFEEDTEDAKKSLTPMLELKIVKNRAGRIGSMRIEFDKSKQKMKFIGGN